MKALSLGLSVALVIIALLLGFLELMRPDTVTHLLLAAIWFVGLAIVEGQPDKAPAPQQPAWKDQRPAPSGKAASD